MFSCSATKKAKRKYRKADKLMREAGILDPSIADTVWVLKTDTLMLTKDSIRTEIRLKLDTVKVDSIIEKLIYLRSQGADTRALRQEIYDELIPDMHYSNTDSLRVDINDETHYIRFNIDVNLDDDVLVITTKPTSNVPIKTSVATVAIDARKMGRWWKGFMWGGISILLILVVLWFLRGTIGTAIKAYMP